jgi:hypothetical protein
MSESLYLLRELLRSMGSRAWGSAALAVVGLAALLGSLALISLLLTPESSRREDVLLAVPREELSQFDLDALYQRLMADPAVAQVRYRFAPPDSGGSHFEIRLRANTDVEAVIARLSAWDELQAVKVPTPEPPGALKALLLDPERRWIALAALLAWGGLTLVLLYLSLLAARRSFTAELELLDLAGANPQTIRLPFAFLGVLLGLVGTALFEGLLIGASAWPPLLLTVTGYLAPELGEPGALLQIGLRGLFLGLLSTGLAGALGWLAAYRYPRPLSRSRISSSSA